MEKPISGIHHVTAIASNPQRNLDFLHRGIGASHGQTHGTLLHSQGTPLKVAQAQLGHSHLATTLEIYTRASGSAQRDL